MVIATAMCIRPATDADLEAIQAIYNHAIETSVATWDEEPWSMEKRLAWFQDHDASEPILVAEIEGEVAGFAGLSRMSQKSGWRFTRENTIYIGERFRGMGVGKVLLSALIGQARELGLRLIVASITSENEASIGLHRDLGFREVGTLENAGFKFGSWLSTTYMQLDLGDKG